MRIGIDIRVLGKKRTGDEVYFSNLVKNLAVLDQKNEYFLYTDRNPEIASSAIRQGGGNRELAKEVKKLNLKNNFKIIFINSPNRFWWNLRALPNYLKKNPIDVFHTQYIAPFWLPKNVKLILTIHDISFNFFPQYIKKSDLFFLKTLLPRGIRRADKIITVSKSEREQIIKFYKVPPEKVGFVHNGVDFEKFNQKFSPEELEEINTKYQIPARNASHSDAGGPATHYILYVGTLQPRKNIPVLVEALKDLNIKLVVVGNRKARNFDKKIDEVIEKNNLEDKMIFPGWVEDEDLPKIYRLAECFAFPSLYEGFGIPVIEAMAAGLPVVCSDIPVLREIGEGAALFCDPKNSQKFAENIQKILSDENLRRDLVEKGKNTAQKFTWQKTAEKTLKIYNNL